MILWCPTCGNRLEVLRSIPSRWRCQEHHEWIMTGPIPLAPYVPGPSAPPKE